MLDKALDRNYSHTTDNSEQPLSKKRKRLQPVSGSHQRKRFKVQDARVIAVQSTGQAFQNGELDVQKYVKSREFEIRALEDSLMRSKKSASGRAFQAVPRSLRRRTASHNVKRVPKRLRSRAAKEMIIDNTPTVTSKTRKRSSRMRLRLNTVQRLKKLNTQRRMQQTETNSQRLKITNLGDKIVNGSSTIKPRKPSIKSTNLGKPPYPPARYRKRQIHKTWIPTHLYHTKRAHMTPPKEPLWRFALPLTPTEKCYRPVHRSISMRGAIAWDISYVSTIGLTGREDRLVIILKALGVGKNADDSDTWHERGCRWRSGSRIWGGWLSDGKTGQSRGIGPAQILWCGTSEPAAVDISDTRKCPRRSKVIRKVIIRLHPAIFLQVWRLVVALCTSSKPAVVAEDLRFEIGSIEMIGPSTIEALVATLRPVGTVHSDMPSTKVESTWEALRPLTNTAMLPHNVLFAFQIVDPRLRFPPLRTSEERNELHRGLVDILTCWPLDQDPVQSPLFSYTARHAATRALPSQKAINRRKRNAMPGNFPHLRSSDPQIPIIAHTSSLTNAGGRRSWTILLPWKCMLPVWYAFMFYPLAGGGTIRFGGLREQRQLAFEEGVPWFPGDFPGTEAGFAWELQQRQRRKGEWQKKPRGRRVEWDSLKLGQGKKGEIGLGWACYWEGFGNDFNIKKDRTEQEADEQRQLKSREHYQVSREFAEKALSHPNCFKSEAPQSALVTVKISMLIKGVPKECARIYRLPTELALRKKWLANARATKEKKSKMTARMSIPAKDSPLYNQKAYLAASLLDRNSILHSAIDQLQVPDKNDLIGFVTTGNFNLCEGKGTAIGSVLLQKIVEQQIDNSESKNTARWNLCIVRESGQSIGRLAHLRLV